MVKRERIADLSENIVPDAVKETQPDKINIAFQGISCGPLQLVDMVMMLEEFCGLRI